MIDFYINKIEILSDNFKLQSEGNYNSISGTLKKMQKTGILYEFKPAKFDDFFIKITLNPQEYYNKCAYKYNKNTDYTKFIKAITDINNELKSIGFENFGVKISPVEKWEVKLIEFSKDIKLEHQFLNYIDMIKCLNPKREGKYSIVGTYENDTSIYFNTKNIELFFVFHVEFYQKK